jgi:hypothetical protein
MTISLSVFGTQELTDISEKWVQDFTDSGIEPFVALRHLHRARNETNDRYKWIDATIAAELAIKEFLMRKEPQLEMLLLELPSPPLDTMYRKILPKYGGGKLDTRILNSLLEGVQIRNKLIHRPQDELKDLINSQKTLNYVNDVAETIKHLLSNLYPEKHIII